MTYDELTAWFDSFRRQSMYIEALKAEREAVWRSITGIKAMRPDKPFVSSSEISDISAKLVAAEDKMRIYDNKLADSLNMLAALRQDVMDTINLCDTPEQKTVLVYRYIAGLDWEEIAAKMKFGTRHPFRIHKAAIHVILSKLNKLGSKWQSKIW